MLISLHKQATTTPKIRAAIQASTDPAWMVAERYGISEQTVWKWRKRDSVHDLSHTPHKLQTTLNPAQEAIAVTLRTTLLLPLDDLLAVVREFLNPHVSRSGLDRCMRRHGVGNLRELKPKEAKPTHSSFKAYEPGYLHIDIKYLPQMADEDRRRYLFVAIDRATRWVFVRIYPTQTAANARRFLRDLARAAPMKITRVTYGALKILRRHLGDDLDLGLIGFAVVLRTRRDLLQLVRLTSARLDRLELFVIENFWFMAVTKEQRVTRSQKTKDPSDKLGNTPIKYCFPIWVCDSLLCECRAGGCKWRDQT